MKPGVSTKLQKRIDDDRNSKLQSLVSELSVRHRTMTIGDGRVEMELNAHEKDGEPKRAALLISVGGADRQLKALQRYTDQLFTPQTRAWMRIAELLDAAQVDPAISINPEAVEFLSTMNVLASPAWGHWKLSEVLQPLADHVKSENARIVASQKNEAPRLWVFLKWASRTDQGQSKAAFARQYAPLVKKEFGLIVTPETIARDWLPRARK
jgi:hypothetical protein